MRRHASRKSPSGKCDRLAFAACWSIARITNALTLQKSAATDGLITSGSLILNLDSFAKRAEKEAPSFGEMMTLGNLAIDAAASAMRSRRPRAFSTAGARCQVRYQTVSPGKLPPRKRGPI